MAVIGIFGAQRTTPTMVLNAILRIHVVRRQAVPSLRTFRDKCAGRSRWIKGVVRGVFYRELSINSTFRLPGHCSIFQAEVAVVKVAVDVLFRSSGMSKHYHCLFGAMLNNSRSQKTL